MRVKNETHRPRQVVSRATNGATLEARNAQPVVHFVIVVNNLAWEKRERNMARPSSRHKNDFNPDAVARA